MPDRPAGTTGGGRDAVYKLLAARAVPAGVPVPDAVAALLDA